MRKFRVGDKVIFRAEYDDPATVLFVEPEDYGGGLVYELRTPGEFPSIWAHESELQLAVPDVSRGAPLSEVEERYAHSALLSGENIDTVLENIRRLREGV